MTSNKVILLASNNWKVMLKALFCQVIILALVAALSLMIFGGLVEEIIEAFSSVEFSEFTQEIFSAFANNNFDADLFAQNVTILISEIHDAVETIPNVWNRVEVSYLLCLALLLGYRLLISLTDVAVGFQVHEFMTSNASRPFTWFFVKKFRESLWFATLQMLLALPLDVMILISCGAICLLLAIVMGLWAIIPAVALLLVLFAVRHALFAFWLPALVSDEVGVRKSLTKGVSTIPYRFGQVFWKTLLIVLTMMVITVVSLLYINNSLLKFVVGTVPNLILFFILKCVNLVEYFEVTNRPYFCKNVNVEGTERYNKKMARKNKKNLG